MCTSHHGIEQLPHDSRSPSRRRLPLRKNILLQKTFSPEVSEVGDGPESPGLAPAPSDPKKLGGLKLGREEVVVELPGRNALKVGKERPPAPLADVMKRNPKDKVQISKLKEAQPASWADPGTPGAGRLDKIIAPLNVVPVLQQLEDAKTKGRHGTGEGAARHFGEAPEVWTCGQNSYGELAHLDTVTRKTHSFVECLKDKDIIHVAAGECHLGSTPPHVCRPLPAAHRCLLLATCR